MWWVPVDEEQWELRSILDRIVGLFVDRSTTISAVYAVGSAAIAARRYPLVLLDQSFGPRATLPLPLRILQRLHAVQPISVGERRKLRGHVRRKRYSILGKADEDVRLLLSPWNLPDETRLQFIPPPLAMAGGGPVPPLVRSWQGISTLGFGVQWDGRMVLTTAGHAVKAVPVSVDVQERRWFWSRTRRLGSIQTFLDPIDAAGLDIATIEAADPLGMSSGDGFRFPARPEDVQDLARVVLFGGRSGRKLGFINAALNATRDIAGRTWTNCWSVVEMERGFAAKGDSGGPVLLEDGSPVGHLVAAYGLQHMNGRYQCGLVQDAATLLAGVYPGSVEVCVPSIRF